MKLKIFLAFSLVTFFNSQLFADEIVVKINNSGDPNAPYAIKMIQLALDHIGKKYTLKITTEHYSIIKTMEEVTDKNLDLFWGSSNVDKETRFAPVRIPLYKGLLGNRIFIIHKNNQSKFDDVKTLDDLKKISIGQGKAWADAKILESNGLKVVRANKNESLFYMLDGGRFDALARGVHEPFGELEKHPNLPDLTIEKNLMLVYRMPYYLFASNDNKTLAKDLEAGLNAAIADGSFEQVFINDAAVKNVIAKANMKTRRIIYLDNPTLSKETPLDRKELWADPKDF